MSILSVPKLSFQAPPANIDAYVGNRRVYYRANMEFVSGVLSSEHGGTGNTSFENDQVIVYSDGKMISSGITTGEIANLKMVNDDIAISRQTLGFRKKNLLKINVSTKTVSGVIFTVNDDGSIDMDGQATSNIFVDIATNIYIPAGDYILSGCPLDGSETTYKLYAYDGTSSIASDYGQGASFSIKEDTIIDKVSIKVSSGVPVTNITVYPMIRSADIVDDSYEPYVDDVTTQLETLSDLVGDVNVLLETI